MTTAAGSSLRAGRPQPGDLAERLRRVSARSIGRLSSDAVVTSWTRAPSRSRTLPRTASTSTIEAVGGEVDPATGGLGAQDLASDQRVGGLERRDQPRRHVGAEAFIESADLPGQAIGSQNDPCAGVEQVVHRVEQLELGRLLRRRGIGTSSIDRGDRSRCRKRCLNRSILRLVGLHR